jgi:hypothetical protein
MSGSKYGSRKYHLALLALAAMFVLALAGKLDFVASAGIIAAAGVYGHFNLKQRREDAQAKVEAEEARAL